MKGCILKDSLYVRLKVTDIFGVVSQGNNWKSTGAMLLICWKFLFLNLDGFINLKSFPKNDEKSSDPLPIKTKNLDSCIHIF